MSSGRHHYDNYELLGVFTTSEKFQAYVAKRFPNTSWQSLADRRRRLAHEYAHVAVCGVSEGEIANSRVSSRMER